MSGICFYLDEDCQAAALATALRQHGIPVVTTNEAGLAAATDDAQLHHAANRQWVLVTNNIADFVILHAQFLRQGASHAGIVVFAQQSHSIGEVVRQLSHLRRTKTPEAVRDQLIWLRTLTL